MYIEEDLYSLRLTKPSVCQNHYFDMFWSKEFWLPNSPDLNPLDHCVWSVVKSVANMTKQPNVTSFPTAVEATFTNRRAPL